MVAADKNLRACFSSKLETEKLWISLPSENCSTVFCSTTKGVLSRSPPRRATGSRNLWSFLNATIKVLMARPSYGIAQTNK